jgi:hypothetical protein
MIYTFGNSHSHFFTDSHNGDFGWGTKQNENFSSFSGNSMNPEHPFITAHKFTERFLPIFMHQIKLKEITREDSIMFIVGEIDCRWHFPKIMDLQKRSKKDVVEKCMDVHFFPSMLELKKNGYDVIGWGGQPSTTRGHDPHPGVAIYGDCLLRNEISLFWNDLLSDRCRSHGMKFVSIIHDLIDENGLTKMGYWKDFCHLNQHAYPLAIKQCKLEGIIKND